MARGSTPALIIVAVLAAGAAASVTDVLGYVNPFAEDTKRLYDGVAGATEAEVSALLEAHGAAGAYREFHCAEPARGRVPTGGGATAPGRASAARRRRDGSSRRAIPPSPRAPPRPRSRPTTRRASRPCTSRRRPATWAPCARSSRPARRSRPPRGNQTFDPTSTRARETRGFALCALRGVLDESTRLVRTSATSTSM